ncbi:Dimethyl-sulfide monooxygenase [Pseudocercospora fuligena]|uniref:Dimethyl-sulfide monooxygenase n=1 Tax=Pseudocercospora fuligena TaxID=685502 RepID=A0A8H6RGR7_9PEZI|nr:Dimethyl-sulfide monooxygenase [Pseudocercospora fuligena]
MVLAVPNGLYSSHKPDTPRDIHRHIDQVHSGARQAQQDELRGRSTGTNPSENNVARRNGLPSPTDGTRDSGIDRLHQGYSRDLKQAQRSELGWPKSTTRDCSGPNGIPASRNGTQQAQNGIAERGESRPKQAQWTELGRQWVKLDLAGNTSEPPRLTNGVNHDARDASTSSRQAQRTELGTPPAGTFDQNKPNGIGSSGIEARKKQAQWTELGQSTASHRPPTSNGIPQSVDGTRHTNGIHSNNLTNGAPRPKKKLILNAFVEMCSGHQSPGLWRHPHDKSSNFNTLTHWTSLAQLLERGSFQGIFIADVLGGYDVYGGPKNLIPAIRSGAQWPVNEPLSIVPAMAAATKSIGFGVTISTSYEQPYHLARRLSTVDHLTNGRVGWNVVTGYLDSAARNLTNNGEKGQKSHDERYEIAEEYMDVVYKLWNESWRSDAVKLDKKAGVYTDPELVREINHKGKYFEVPGPHFCAPSPQRTPVIMQAGTSKSGKRFAAKHAEAIFVSAHSPASVVDSAKGIRAEAGRRGRDPSKIKFLAKFCPVLGRTQEEAEAKYRDYIQYGDYEGALALFGGWTGVDMAPYGDDEELRYVESNAIRSYIEGLLKTAPDVNGGKWTKKTLAEHIMVGGLGATCVGTPEKVADEMERWVREGDVDGFNIAYALMPQTFEDVIELLIPELRKRELFWDGYRVPGGTYRENLYETPGQHEPLPDHPAAERIWRPNTEHPKTSDVRAVVNGIGAHPKSVGFQMNGNAFKGDAKGRMDFEDVLSKDDLIDAASMQLG